MQDYNSLLSRFYVVLFLLMFSVLGYIGYGLYKDIQLEKAYKSFCEDKPDFCYCGFDKCKFKTCVNGIYCGFDKCKFKTQTTQTCVNGICSDFVKSNDTLKLCELAKKLNDKETFFDAGCN